MDLMFPHHENEIAQSEGLYNNQFVRYWVHNAFVRINKEKMSKSLGNFFTLREVFAKFDPMLIRFYFLNHHYRSPLDFSFDDLEALHKSYQRLCRIFANVKNNNLSVEAMRQSAIVEKMLAFLTDDLNTPGMWGVLFENLDTLQQNPQELMAVKNFIYQVLGLPLELLPEKTVTMTPEIERLIQEREQARKEKNWKQADLLRDQLAALGFVVQDKKLN
jgi:cysteinyl-tRNA synthetase